MLISRRILAQAVGSLFLVADCSGHCRGDGVAEWLFEMLGMQQGTLAAERNGRRRGAPW